MFWVNNFVHSLSGTYYTLLLGCFCQKVFTGRSSLCLLSFGWYLSPRFVPQDWKQTFYWSLPGPERKVRLCETVWFLSWVNTHPFDLKFVAFCPEFSEDSCVEFQEKNYFGRIFQKISCKPRLSSTKTCLILPYFLQFLFCVRIALKNITQVLSYVVCT